MGPFVQNLIAHYLLNTYPSALPSFLEATGIDPPDPQNPPDTDLRTLAADYLSQVNLEGLSKFTVQDQQEVRAKDIVKDGLDSGVQLKEVTRVIDGVSTGNLLTVEVGRIPSRRFDTSSASYVCAEALCILTASVDKSISVINHETGELEHVFQPHKAAVLCLAQHPTKKRYLISGSMDGTTIITDMITQQTIQTLRSAKFVVKIACSPDGKFLATASYDKNIVIYEASCMPIKEDETLDDTDDAELACEPSIHYKEAHRIKLENNPEAILFHPKSNWLMFTSRSSYQLHYISLRDWTRKTKSFNAHPMDDHISFAVLNLVLHPSGKLVACQTGDNAGRSGERILLYGVEPEETERLGCIWTGSETDDFVLPRASWLPDGKGLITTSPNGYLHLLSINGELRSSLKTHGVNVDGQAISEVVKDCGMIDLGDGRWEVVSIGYDRVVKISR